MSDTKHTPGPCSCGNPRCHVDDGAPQIARQNLIAAAPDLLAACKALLEAYTRPEAFSADVHDIRETAARAAIAKAEGRS